jgi:hypothetical protein
MADQGADWTGVYAYPEAYATFNRSWPADYVSRPILAGKGKDGMLTCPAM